MESCTCKDIRLSGWKAALGISNPEVNIRFLGVASSMSKSAELMGRRAQEACSWCWYSPIYVFVNWTWKMFLLLFFFLLVSSCRLFLDKLACSSAENHWILLAITPGKHKLVTIITAGGVGVGLQSLRLSKRRQIKTSSLESERWIMSGFRKFLNFQGEPGVVIEEMLIIFVCICIFI